jgi:predicted amidohydrolase
VQLGPSLGTRDANLDRVLRMIDKAHARGANIVAFPELCLTDYFPFVQQREKGRDYVEMVDDMRSTALQAVRNRARQKHINVILPFAENAGEYWYNSALLVNDLGEDVGLYRKVHLGGGLPAPSDGWIDFQRAFFASGNLGFPVFDLPTVGKIGIQICYDRNLPEGSRCLALGGATILFIPSAVPVLERDGVGVLWGADLWRLVLRARAFENAVFVVGSAKAGREMDRKFAGNSLIISPLGARVLAEAESQGDELLVARIGHEEAEEARRILQYGRARCPGSYVQLIGR